MALSCTYSEIKRDIDRKSWIFIPLAFDAPVRGSPSEYCYPVWCGKTRMVWLPVGEKKLRICVIVLVEYWRVTGRRTNRQTDILRRHSPRYANASRGKKFILDPHSATVTHVPISLFVALFTTARFKCAWRHSQLRLPTPLPWQPRMRLKVGGRMLPIIGS